MEVIFDKELECFRALVESKGGFRKFRRELNNKRRMQDLGWKEMFNEEVGQDWRELWDSISGISKDSEVKIEYREIEEDRGFVENRRKLR